MNYKDYILSDAFAELVSTLFVLIGMVGFGLWSGLRIGFNTIDVIFNCGTILSKYPDGCTAALDLLQFASNVVIIGSIVIFLCGGIALHLLRQ